MMECKDRRFLSGILSLDCNLSANLMVLISPGLEEIFSTDSRHAMSGVIGLCAIYSIGLESVLRWMFGVAFIFEKRNRVYTWGDSTIDGGS